MSHDYSIMLFVGTDCLVLLSTPAEEEKEEEEDKNEESNKTLTLNRLTAGGSSLRL